MRNEYSDDQQDAILTRVHNWYREFEQTPAFGALSDEQQDQAGFVISSFSEYMYSYQLCTPEDWNLSDLQEVCLQILPRKVTADEDYFQSVAPVLSTFFTFLTTQGYLKNTQPLSKVVSNFHAEIIQRAADPENWGMAKSLCMGAMKQGIDISDTEKLNNFMIEYNRKLSTSSGLKKLLSSYAQVPIRTEPKVGRNEPCTCGSGRKYKKCCGFTKAA